MASTRPLGRRLLVSGAGLVLWLVLFQLYRQVGPWQWPVREEEPVWLALTFALATWVVSRSWVLGLCCLSPVGGVHVAFWGMVASPVVGVSRRASAARPQPPASAVHRSTSSRT